MPAFAIRTEQPEDAAEIFAVIEAAFGDADVARFAEQIRASPSYVPELAFVAEENAELIGHTMLSRVEVMGQEIEVLILTPMSVRPDRQRRGVGVALVQAALDAGEERGEPLVLVEGIPAYYPRFGFRSANDLGLACPDEGVPDEAWMVRTLSAFDPMLRGQIVYPQHFPARPSRA